MPIMLFCNVSQKNATALFYNDLVMTSLSRLCLYYIHKHMYVYVTPLNLTMEEETEGELLLVYIRLRVCIHIDIHPIICNPSGA